MVRLLTTQRAAGCVGACWVAAASWQVAYWVVFLRREPEGQHVEGVIAQVLAQLLHCGATLHGSKGPRAPGYEDAACRAQLKWWPIKRIAVAKHSWILTGTAQQVVDVCGLCSEARVAEAE
jgi:hypothetical protein